MSLSDESSCVVIDVRTVKIKMFDGVIHTLAGVIYVPKMRRNLISLLLGWMDSKGCRYLVTGRAMKITQGCLALMKGERCQDGLYRLSGSMGKSIHLISMGSWKQSTQNDQHWYRVSFTDITIKKSGTDFQVTDDGEGVFVIRED